MIVWIQNLLTRDQLDRVVTALDTADFDDGKKTAGLLARGAKENLELRSTSPKKDELDALVLDAIHRNKTFEAAARPKRIVTPIFSRYRSGMHYGSHLDNPVMARGKDPIRVDLSMTLFLSPPDSYDGGELSIDTEYGTKAVKVPAGDAVIYPTIYYHEVKPVTRGERLACITWIQSLVPDPQKRQILYDMAVFSEWLHAKAPGSPQFRQFRKTYLNLYRMWAEA